ncbi:MAG: gliding motility-associated C-terminal domain-containing protein [Bacteroidales bacterium]|nr:gliding motility-associated C-terminal domain-containing protein [Bacteroidales bacterium]
MSKRLYILLIIFTFLTGLASASHFMGGEITWECINSNGKYRFILKLYRECYGIEYEKTEILQVINHPTVKKITMTLVSRTDNSPVCNPAGPSITCNNPPAANRGAIEEWLYTSDAVYPSGVSLNGVPDKDQGWIFAYKGYNRNFSTNLVAADQTWGLRAVMYPYQGKNAGVCYDNSPTFAEKPSTVICTGYHFTYNPNAYDKELDSLVYDWAMPLDSNMNKVLYNSNFQYYNPLPGPFFDPNNIADTINPQTGEISFLSYTQGSFLTVSKVTAYKNKEKVAEIFREMQIVLVNCASNIPPDVIPPFKDINTGIPTYIDTVFAGQLVNFKISATDTVLQNISVKPSGPQFGSGFTNSATGCLTPPCATLNPYPINGVKLVETDFNWQTTCSHLTHPVDPTGSEGNLIFNNPVQSNIHNFVFSVSDDYCPVSGKNVATITIVIKKLPELDAPLLTCTAVDDSGKVTLNWIPQIDTLNSFFMNYIYFASNPAGPFNLLDSIADNNITSYIHKDAGADTKVLYYYIITRSACHHLFYSKPSNIVQTLYLELTNLDKTKAQLDWNNIKTGTVYEVMREYPSGKWNKINTTGNIQYIDTISICSAFINFRIQVYDSIAGCYSFSNVKGDSFSDHTGPFPPPEIDSVSIDPLTGKVIIGWSKSATGDIVGYGILKNNSPADSSTSVIGKLLSKDSTFFVNNTSNPDSEIEIYSIIAIDSCGNESSASLKHNTLLLTLNPDPCNNSIMLSWNPYKNMKGLAGYKIYIKKPGDTVFSLAGNTGINQRSYNYTNVNQNAEYCFFIRAYNDSGTVSSSSNIRCINAAMLIKPKYIYLRYASVFEENSSTEYIKVSCFIDNAAFISKLVIQRSDTNSGYSNVYSLTNINQPTVEWIDKNVRPANNSYTYIAELYDSCGQIAVTSNIAKTILLKAVSNTDLSNTLNWNNYSSWDGNLGNYYIYRSIGNNSNKVLIASVAPSAPYNTYTDDISSFILGDGTFYYTVQAIEADSNVYNFKDNSFSNKAAITQPPKYFIPTAFVPDGKNNKFLPIGVFTDKNNYVFRIFNRWGKQVFESKEPNEGWDGTESGKDLPEGIYIYLLQFKDGSGKALSKKGTVTLVR